MEKYFIILCITGFISACSTSRVQPIEEKVEQDVKKTEIYMQAVNEGKKVQASEPEPIVLNLKDEVYMPVRKIITQKSASVLSSPLLTRNVTINRSFTSVTEIAERLTALSTLPAVVSPDVTPSQTSHMQATASPTGAAPANAVAPSNAQSANTGGGPGSGINQSQINFPINFAYTGSLAGFLDLVTARLGISWEMEEGQLRLFRLTSRSFRLSALPGDTSMNAAVGSSSAGGASSGSSAGSSGGSSGASSSQSLSSSHDSSLRVSSLSVWQAVEDSIKPMLSMYGRIVSAPAIGTITVTDTPTVINSVAKFIEAQNKSLTKQVAINVQVLSVNQENTDGYGIDWSAIYQSLRKNYSINFSSNTPNFTTGASSALSILRTSTNVDDQAASSWDGSKAIIQALQTQGRVSTLTSVNVTTLNNQPVPIQVGRQTSYVASSTTSISTGLGVSSLQPGVINSGFSMSILPHLLDGKEMLLQYAIDISSLISLSTVSTQNSVIQTPDLDTKNSIQRVMVQSGDTIVLAGFESEDQNSKTQGVVSASNPALGGSVATKKIKNSIVMLMRPVLMD